MRTNVCKSTQVHYPNYRTAMRVSVVVPNDVMLPMSDKIGTMERINLVINGVEFYLFRKLLYPVHS